MLHGVSTPFLINFTEAIVRTLLERGELELSGDRDAVVAFVSQNLASGGEGRSLISTFTAALLACPDVEELYADDETLKELVTELPRDLLHRGRR